MRALITRFKTLARPLITRLRIEWHKGGLHSAALRVVDWNVADCSFHFACAIGLPSAVCIRDKYNHHLRVLRQIDPDFPPGVKELP